jgi:hypothetical protein
MNAKDVLLGVKEVAKSAGDQKAIYSSYLEFSRRLEVLRLIKERRMIVRHGVRLRAFAMGEAPALTLTC